MLESNNVNSDNGFKKKYSRVLNKVLNLDYIQGPNKKFLIKKRFSSFNHGASIDDMLPKCNCSSDDFVNEEISSKYTHDSVKFSEKLASLFLVADFYSKVDKKPVINPYNSNNVMAEYVKKDRFGKLKDGQKYMNVSKKEEEILKEILGCTCSYDALNHATTTLSEFTDAFDLTQIRGNTSIVPKTRNDVSLLVSNSYESVGSTHEYIAPDELVVGSRRSVKGKPVLDKDYARN